MNTSSFSVLGSSSGMPQPHRATSGYLLTVDGRASLIDCGGGVTASFLRHGYDPLAVDSVFISHGHSDHVCELTLFIQLVYLSGRSEPLRIYLPEELVEPFRTWLHAVYLLESRLPFQLEVRGYTEGVVHEDRFRLTAHRTTHLDKLRDQVKKAGLPNKLQCHAFTVESGGQQIFYSADVGSIEDIRPHLDGCRYVFTELTHIDREAFFACAREADVGQFIITHLGSEEEVASICLEARKAGVNNLATAVDGMVVGW